MKRRDFVKISFAAAVASITLGSTAIAMPIDDSVGSVLDGWVSAYKAVDVRAMERLLATDFVHQYVVDDHASPAPTNKSEWLKSMRRVSLHQDRVHGRVLRIIGDPVILELDSSEYLVSGIQVESSYSLSQEDGSLISVGGPNREIIFHLRERPSGFVIVKIEEDSQG